MRGPLDQDDVEALEVSARTAEQHRAAARQLAQWSGEDHPDDEVSPAALLVAAAWHLEVLDDHESALDLLRRAAAAPGETLPDVRCYLHSGLLKAGRPDEARQLAEEVRRSRPVDPDVYQFIAEDYELSGDLERANRWSTLGLTRLLRTGDGTEADVSMLASARLRARRALGFPEDDLDLLAAPRLSQDEGEP